MQSLDEQPNPYEPPATATSREQICKLCGCEMISSAGHNFICDACITGSKKRPRFASRWQIALAFGVVDAFYLAPLVPFLHEPLIDAMKGNLVSILFVIIIAMLCFSAISWCCQTKHRFLITYILFPFRVLIAAFSLFWLMIIGPGAFPGNYTVHYCVWGTACAVEVIRLKYTLSIHQPRDERDNA